MIDRRPSIGGIDLGDYAVKAAGSLRFGGIYQGEIGSEGRITIPPNWIGFDNRSNGYGRV